MANGSIRCLLAVVAHPDDETFGCGGLLAKCAAEEVRVVLICATRGEAGKISDPSLATPENLAQVREGELRAACDILGVQELHILRYRDSGMEGAPENGHPEALCRADNDEVVREIVGIIRRNRPQVMLTFDPNGGYGHPDHIAIHDAAREAFHAAGDPDRYPGPLDDSQEPYRPHKLYYFVFPRSAVRAFREAAREAGLESGMGDIDPESMGVSDHEVTTLVDVGRYMDKSAEAARCHRTQIRGDPFGWMPESLRARLLSTEHLVRAEPPFNHGEPVEKDIFAGI